MSISPVFLVRNFFYLIDKVSRPLKLKLVFSVGLSFEKVF